MTKKRLPCIEIKSFVHVAPAITKSESGQLGGRLGSLLVQAQVVCRRQQLEANLDGNLHVRNVFAVAVSVPVVEVFDHLVEDHGAVGGLD